LKQRVKEWKFENKNTAKQKNKQVICKIDKNNVLEKIEEELKNDKRELKFWEGYARFSLSSPRQQQRMMKFLGRRFGTEVNVFGV